VKTYIGLIRGINVGGKNMVKMADLRTMLTEIGLPDSQTLLQSGNFVFKGKERGREEMEKWLREESEKRLGVNPEYFVRTLAEWDEIIAANPFPEEAKADPSHLLVTLLKSPPDESQVKAIQAAIKGPERIRVGKEHLYTVFPEGIGTSTIGKTPGYNKLIAVGTGRNWNTVLKLADLARA